MINFFTFKKSIFFLLILSIPLILPYFHSGYFPTHDGEWAVVRLSDMYRELRDFQLPPRMSEYLNFEYGYPLFNFAYPFPYYLGFFLHIFHLGFVNSIKTVFALTVIFSSLGMFLLSRKLWGTNLSGIISALLYIYLPYRLVDLYVRGSIGESISFALFPFLIYLLLKIKEERIYYPYVSVASFLYGALIASHNIMAVYFTLILLPFIIITSWDNFFLLKRFLIFILLGLSLSSFFWVPALVEKKNILLSVIPIADRNLYYVSLPQLILPSWGYGTPTEKDAFTYQIGLPHLIVFFTSIFLVFLSLLRKTEGEKHFKYQLFLLVSAIVAILCMFSFFSQIWKLPLLSEINYPWTLLAPLGFLISLASGWIMEDKRLQAFGILLCLSAIILYFPDAHPKNFVDRGDSFYVTNQATTTSSNELMPLWVKRLPFKSPDKQIEILTGNGSLNLIKSSSKEVFLTADLLKESTVRINRVYYPGWEIKINGRSQQIRYNNSYGVMDITIPAGKSEIKASFKETPLRTVVDFTSSISFMLLIGLFFFKKTFNIHKSKNEKNI